MCCPLASFNLCLGKALADYQAQADKSFNHEARMKELLVRQAQLNTALDLDKGDNQVAPMTDNGCELGFEADGTPPAPPSPSILRRQPPRAIVF